MHKIAKILPFSPDPIDVHLGKKLREFRNRVGWTLTSLAERVGVSHQLIHKYELAHTKISANMLYTFSHIFSTTPNAFFEGYTPQEEESSQSDTDDTISLKERGTIKLLLIEDSSADEFLIRKVLEASDYHFETYCIHNGGDAVNYFKSPPSETPFTRPDLVLLDLNIPKLDGFSVLRAIKQDRNIKDIPVIILTNSLRKSDMVMAYKNFASGYVSKSFEPHAFRKNLEATLAYWIDTVILPEGNDAIRNIS